MDEVDVGKHASIKLGAQGPEVFPIGLGCMGMSGMYGAFEDQQGVATIHAALERGITLFDTGDFYGMGHNELLLGQALRGKRERALISVKFGALRGPDGSWLGVDARPVAVKNFASYTLKRLGVEVIDIYRPARLDPAVPIEDTVGAITELIQKGYVRYVGLSEVGAETIRRAHAIHPISDLQIEYSLVSRRPETEIFPVLRELGISATLYGVLSRGLLSGSQPKDARDFRAYLPRFRGDNRAHNDRLVASLRTFASARGMSPVQVAVAWVVAKQPGFLPLVGARSVAQVDDALAALGHPLDQNDLEQLEALLPAEGVAGDRYDAAQMAHLDSER